ncbi:unnamed protein product, partial [Ascophyllum nodosum]
RSTRGRWVSSRSTTPKRDGASSAARCSLEPCPPKTAREPSPTLLPWPLL